MKTLLPILLLVVSTTIMLGQKIEAITTDGKQVELDMDGTWSFKKSLSNAALLNPEYASKPYFLLNGELENFEKSNATLTSKTKAFGLGGINTFYTIFDGESSVRFKKVQQPQIIVKIDTDTDPEDFFMVMRAEDRGRIREVKMAGRTMTGGVKNLENKEVTFEIIELKDKIYEMSLENLEPGEYVIIPRDDIEYSDGASLKLYCFGIDQ